MLPGTRQWEPGEVYPGGRGSSWEGSTWGDPPGGLQFLAINNNQGYNGPPGRGLSGGGPPGRGLTGGDPPGGPQFPVINTNKGHNNQMGGQFDTLAASMYLGSYKPKGTPLPQNLILVVPQRRSLNFAKFSKHIFRQVR